MAQQNHSWHKPYPIQHWLPHLWLPAVLFIVLFFWLEPYSVNDTSQHKTIRISLQAPQPIEAIKPISKPPIQTQPILTAKKEPIKPIDTITSTKLTTPKTSVTITDQTKPKVSTAELFKQAKQPTDIRISDDFKAATPNAYKPQSFKVHDAYADIPYLPTDDPYSMNLDFYATGIEGNIDRFFDKVILKKTFTTKYGTKINCALAVLLLCSWK